MKTHNFKPTKKLLAEYLMNSPLTTGFTWLNRYLEKIRSKIISMDNLICIHLSSLKGIGDMDFTLALCWIVYSSLAGSMSNIDFITCGIAVIAALKLFVLQPWSSTSMSHLVNTDFGVSAVEKMCTVLPPVNTSSSMISWLPSLMS